MSSNFNFSFVSTLEKTKCLVIPFFEEGLKDKFVKELDFKVGGLIAKVREEKDFLGKKMQTTLLFTQNKDFPRVLLIGLGKEKELNLRRFKQVVGASVVQAQDKKFIDLAIYLPELIIKKLGAIQVADQAVVAGFLATYAFDEHKTEKDSKTVAIKNINFIASVDSRILKQMQTAGEKGSVVGKGINFARHLGNTPPTVMTPKYLADEAVKMAKENKKLKTTIISQKEIEKLGMGLLLGVARGSLEEAKFIIVEYWGNPSTRNLAQGKPTVFVGKGITFDSGGLSLKPRNYLVDMKFDMLGAATVLGIIKVAADLGIKKNLVALIPAAENMPDGAAFRPDDILVAMDGKTVEIGNTDAEGRLVLADAICYSKKYNPKELIILATLTGGCMVALGTERSGLMTLNDKMSEKIIAASNEVGEYLWRLPLGEEYTEGLKSEVADMKNDGGVDGNPSFGQASVGAAFLQNFIDCLTWAHIDLSCSYNTPKGKSYIRAGANGFGVETFIEYLGNN